MSLYRRLCDSDQHVSLQRKKVLSVQLFKSVFSSGLDCCCVVSVRQENRCQRTRNSEDSGHGQFCQMNPWLRWCCLCGLSGGHLGLLLCGLGPTSKTDEREHEQVSSHRFSSCFGTRMMISYPHFRYRNPEDG